MIKIVNGNILNATEDIICHQTNCCGKMNSGLAKQIRNKYPEVFREYEYICNTYKRYDLLGGTQLVRVSNNKYICNVFGQLYYGTDRKYTDYNAVADAFNDLLYKVKNKEFSYYNMSIAIPYNMGCGLGGGDWKVVNGIIEDVFENYDKVVIYKFE